MYSVNDWRNYSPNELYHHGIKGQKWGVRRYQNSDGSLTEEGRERYSSSNKSSGQQKNGKEGFIDPASLLLISTMTLEAIWWGNMIGTVVSSIKKDSDAKKMCKKCDDERAKAKTDPKTGLKVQSQRKTREEDMKRVNPAFRLDPSGARQNCTNCTLAYELRRRGYEVQAKRMLDGRNGEKFAKDLFPKTSTNAIRRMPDTEDEMLRFNQKYKRLAQSGKNRELAQMTLSSLSHEPSGSRGQLLLTWGLSGGHSVAYEIGSNGKVSIIDAQSSTIYEGKKAEKFISYAMAAKYQRLDNSDFDSEKVKEGVR